MRNKTALVFVVVSLTFFFIASGAWAAEKRQFNGSASLPDSTNVSITVVTNDADEKAAQLAISQTLSEVKKIFDELFATDGVEEKLNHLPKNQSLQIPEASFDLISKAVNLSALTNGWFDITAVSPKNSFTQRDWRRISLDPATRSIVFKSDSMRVDLKNIALGYAADVAMKALLNAGFNDAMVEIGPVRKISGNDIFTPWNLKIPFGDEGSLAHRAYGYNLTNISIATVTPDGLAKDLIDARSKRPINLRMMKNITVFAADATSAVAYAISAYTIGPKFALQFIKKHPEVKGIMVDNVGNLFVSEGFELKNAQLLSEAPPLNYKDRGPNDVRQKEAEEARK